MGGDQTSKKSQRGVSSLFFGCGFSCLLAGYFVFKERCYSVVKELGGYLRDPFSTDPLLFLGPGFLEDFNHFGLPTILRPHQGRPSCIVCGIDVCSRVE